MCVLDCDYWYCSSCQQFFYAFMVQPAYCSPLGFFECSICFHSNKVLFYD